MAAAEVTPTLETTGDDDWCPKDMIEPEMYTYTKENYVALLDHIKINAEGDNYEEPVLLGNLLEPSFMKELRTDTFDDKSKEVLETTQPSLLGTIDKTFPWYSEIQQYIYPRGVYMATINVQNDDRMSGDDEGSEEGSEEEEEVSILQEFVEDMEDNGTGISLLAHIIDPATGIVHVVILFLHPFHAEREKYTKGANNLVETEVMFLYSGEPVANWRCGQSGKGNAAEQVSTGALVYLLGVVSSKEQPFRDVVLGTEGTVDQKHHQFPVWFQHLEEIMHADWEVGYLLRQSPWAKQLYAQSKKKMLEMQADPDFSTTNTTMAATPLDENTPLDAEKAKPFDCKSIKSIQKSIRAEKRSEKLRRQREKAAGAVSRRSLARAKDGGMADKYSLGKGRGKKELEMLANPTGWDYNAKWTMACADLTSRGKVPKSAPKSWNQIAQDSSSKFDPERTTIADKSTAAAKDDSATAGTKTAGAVSALEKCSISTPSKSGSRVRRISVDE